MAICDVATKIMDSRNIAIRHMVICDVATRIVDATNRATSHMVICDVATRIMDVWNRRNIDTFLKLDLTSEEETMFGVTHT